jgi:3-oxoadipate enol-lactonase
MQVFADDGARIDARVDGPQRASAVVFIHGFPLTREIWNAQAHALAPTLRVLLPDLRGAGTSSAPQGPYLMERLAADIAMLFDAAGIERAALVGHSMGGYVALAFARMFTERVTRLALVTSRLRADTSAEASARRALADRIERENSTEPAISAYLPHLFAPQAFAAGGETVERAYAIARKNSPTGLAGALRGMALRAPSDDLAEDLDLDVLWIAGALDGAVSEEEVRSDAGRFPRGRVAICEESGHLPMMEEPERVTATLTSWLAESSP